LKQVSGILIDRANQELGACQLLLEQAYYSVAVSRSYYAMLYAAQALLTDIGMQFTSHGAVHAAFGQHFAKTGRVDSRFHRNLLDLFKKRQVIDYDVPFEASLDDAEKALQQAREFVAMAESYLDRRRQKPHGTT
jgi:uncharacterized protein (UPF0332 family)